MNLLDAVAGFSKWSEPWTFHESVRARLAPDSDEAKVFEVLVNEASRFEHWKNRDLASGEEVARAAIKMKFPDVEEEVIQPIVRAASYEVK